MNHTVVTTTCCVYRRTIPGATPATRQRRIPSVFGNAPSRRRSLLAYRGRLASQALSGGGARPAQSRRRAGRSAAGRSEEHTSELQSLRHLVCRLLLEKKK